MDDVSHEYDFPKVRQVELHPSRERPGLADLTDPTGIAAIGLTMSEAALFVLAMMDGSHDRLDIQAGFMRRHGRMLFSDELDGMIRRLDEALFLEGPRFEAHLTELAGKYRQAAVRPLRDKDALGAPVEKLAAFLDSMLGQGAPAEDKPKGGVVGLAAPHLDYARGGPCYAAAYGGLAERTDAVRFVILGANHFGWSRSVVGTRKDFETPFGLVRHDAEFMSRMDRRCGLDLCEKEYDHVREHSVELQVVLLRHVLNRREFVIAPYLCPDPCGPSGTAPGDGRGADLKAFAAALVAEIAADGVPTCVIAGADLSHVGRYFRDGRDLEPDFLREVEESDRRALHAVLESGPEAFREEITASRNATNICSVGCIYVLATTMKSVARPRLLRYHQAVISEAENCVTCAAMEFTSGG